jgi:hypothetical protein
MLPSHRAIEKDQLANYAMSTQEALEQFRQGKDVVHPIFMVFGQRAQAGPY